MGPIAPISIGGDGHHDGRGDGRYDGRCTRHAPQGGCNHKPRQKCGMRSLDDIDSVAEYSGVMPGAYAGRCAHIAVMFLALPANQRRPRPWPGVADNPSLNDLPVP